MGTFLDVGAGLLGNGCALQLPPRTGTHKMIDALITALFILLSIEFCLSVFVLGYIHP
jgi:hypothetical protein